MRVGLTGGYNRFDQSPIAIEIGLLVVWAVLILGFVQIMNSYYKPRTDIPRIRRAAAPRADLHAE